MKTMYKTVVTGNRYDYERANQHHGELISQKVKAKDMPSIESAFIDTNHCGCCLHYGMALFKLLREAGIDAYISITMEENPITHKMTDNHVSVYYVKDGKGYIADPVETVKSGKGENFDIPVQEYYDNNGTIWIYDPYGEYGEELFYQGFLNHPLKTFNG
ncbi:MAG: hypothetical protein IKG42_01020 [Clostridia bacterium]|nr:hypothetical protein [Clostridia bacterium]